MTTHGETVWVTQAMIGYSGVNLPPWDDLQPRSSSMVPPVAERVGFEPTVPLPVRPISNRVH